MSVEDEMEETLRMEISELRAELEAARRDAMRYRWLRDCKSNEAWSVITDIPLHNWDKVIDAAMKGKS